MRLQAGGVQRTGKPSGLKRVPYTVFSLHMEESNMKKMKRIISAALTLALAAGMLAGCAGSSSGTPAASSAGGASAGSSSAERERITVRVFRSKASHEVAMDQMDVFKVMGEMFNIDFEFDNPPQENYTERLNLVMMETELPDVIMEIPVTDVLKYGETGVILPLNDYIENSMPNLKAEMDKRDGVEKALTYSDGNIYYLPMLDETPSGNIPYIVRTDWLDQLGLERPVTIEDWENYWSLVKTTDLNGNGKNDEIPFSAYEIERLRNFCTAWGVLDDFYTDPTDGGKVHYGPIEAEVTYISSVKYKIDISHLIDGVYALFRFIIPTLRISHSNEPDGSFAFTVGFYFFNVFGIDIRFSFDTYIIGMVIYYIASGKQEQTSQKGIHILSFHNLLRLFIENFRQRYSFQTYGQCSFFRFRVMEQYCRSIV